MQKEEKQQTTIIFDDSSSIQTDATTKAASNIRSRKVSPEKAMSETILDNAYRVITRSTQQDFVSILSCYVNPLYENARPDFRSAFLDIFGVDLFHIPFEDVANWYADHSRQFPRPQVVSTGISTSTVSSLTVGHSAGSTDPTTDSSGLSPARSD